MNIPDLIFENYCKYQNFGPKILKFFDADPVSGALSSWFRCPGWKESDLGSGINIPDPEHTGCQ
jgi:hypothetical protein